jgi:hypothetical protein
MIAYGIPVDKDIAIGITMPMVLFSIYFGMHSIRAKLTKQSKKVGSVKKLSIKKRPITTKKS